MDTPAAAARRILLGTGIGLLVISGLLFINNMLPPSSCGVEEVECIDTGPVGWVIPASAVICLIIGALISARPDALSSLFPTMDINEMNEEIQHEYESEQDTSQLGGAWASLEENLLSNKLEEE